MHILLANFTKMVNDSGGMAKVTCSFANEMVKREHKVSWGSGISRGSKSNAGDSGRSAQALC